MATNINADNGVVSGSAGLKTSADSSGVLALQTNGITAVAVDTSQNVGIGNTSPSGYKLAIGDGSSNRGRIMLKGATSGNYPEINIDDTMNSGGKNYQIYSTGGQLKVVNSTDSNVSFVANGAGIGLGDNAPVDGDGIRFPATQSASSNANTLDDYEEGSWTPAVLSGGVGITINTATYTKIGRMVYFQCDVTIASNSNASAFVLSGLPFSPSSSRFSGVSIGYNTSATAMLALIGGTNLEFYFTSGASSISNLLASGARFIVGGCYQS